MLMTWRNTIRVGVGASLALGLVVALNATHARPARSAEPAKVVAIDFDDATSTLEFVRIVAAAFGEESPSSVNQVKSSRAHAVAALTGDSIDKEFSSDVVVIELTGDFKARDAGPPGAPPTVGRILTLFVDPATGFVTDVSLSPEPLGLGRLGTVREVVR